MMILQAIIYRILTSDNNHETAVYRDVRTLHRCVLPQNVLLTAFENILQMVIISSNEKLED